MRKGKKSEELDAAILWLSTMIERGPILAKLVEKAGPASWRTMRRAKDFMRLGSKQVNGAWYWYRLDKGFSLSKDTMPAIEPDDAPRYQANTAEITLGVKARILQGQEDDEILTGIIQDCAVYPMPKPYSREYIKSVVMNEIHGTPIRKDLNENPD